MEWRPNPKQETALKLRMVDELFYGGARGGGKTIFLLADFLAGANEWGEHWAGILFRKSYSELEQVIREAKNMYFPLGGEYHKAENYFSFPNGATIKFRYLETDEDCGAYQGHEYTWIGFDELGNYRTNTAWKTLTMCLRSSRVPSEWLRIRGTGNPGGVGHKWLKAYFIEGRIPEKVYEIPAGRTADGVELKTTRAFVPATVYDNPALLKTDPLYIARLMNQPEQTRAAMLEGRWDIKGGGEFFDKFDETLHVIQPRLLQGAWHRFYAFDWGYTSPYALVKLAVNKDGRVIIYDELYGQGLVDGVEKENVGTRESSLEVAAKIAQSMAREGVKEIVADNSLWDERDKDSVVIENLYKYGIYPEKSIKNRQAGWSKVLDLMQVTTETGTPYLQIFSTCKYTIREMSSIQCDKTDPEIPDTRMADHALDALRYGIMSSFYGNHHITIAPIRDTSEPPPSYAYHPQEHGYWKRAG